MKYDWEVSQNTLDTGSQRTIPKILDVFTSLRNTHYDFARNGGNFLVKLYGSDKAKTLDHVHGVKEDIFILSFQTGNTTQLVRLPNTSQFGFTI